MGRSQTEETKEKIRQANYKKTYYKTLKFREKMRIAAKKRIWTDEQKEKMRHYRLGKKDSIEINKKKASRGEKNGMWKGAKASYAAIHIWIVKWKGKPNICVDCNITSSQKRIEWSNIDHKYKRILDNYVGRCISCHRKYDIKRGYRVFGRLIS